MARRDWEIWDFCKLRRDEPVAERRFIDLAYQLINWNRWILEEYFALWEADGADCSDFKKKGRGTMLCYDKEVGTQYLKHIDGRILPKVKSKTLGLGTFGQGWPDVVGTGRINLNRAWLRCIRKDFDNPTLPFQRRLCALIDLAGVILHETMHVVGDLGQARARSIQGYFWWRLQTFLGIAGNQPVFGCASAVWPCGATVDWPEGPCSGPQLQAMLGGVRYSLVGPQTTLPNGTVVPGPCWPR